MASSEASTVADELRAIRMVLASFALIQIALSIGLVFLVAMIAFE
jgi:hypothetical protein